MTTVADMIVEHHRPGHLRRVESHEINSAMLTLGMADISLGIGEEKVPSALRRLMHVSLADMLAAKEFVQAENEAARLAAVDEQRRSGGDSWVQWSTCMIPDDRLIAAIYAWFGWALRHRSFDDDEPVLLLKTGSTYRGLMVISRDARALEGEDDGEEGDA